MITPSLIAESTSRMRKEDQGKAEITANCFKKPSILLILSTSVYKHITLKSIKLVLLVVLYLVK